jgi:hypothetical protein
MAHRTKISVKLRMLRVSHFGGLLSRSMVSVVVSMLGPMMMVPIVCLPMLMCVILHIALTLPDVNPRGLPILPQGLSRRAQ